MSDEEIAKKINEILKPLEFDLELYAKISKPLAEFIFNDLRKEVNKPINK